METCTFQSFGWFNVHAQGVRLPNAAKSLCGGGYAAYINNIHLQRGVVNIMNLGGGKRNLVQHAKWYYCWSLVYVRSIGLWHNCYCTWLHTFIRHWTRYPATCSCAKSLFAYLLKNLFPILATSMATLSLSSLQWRSFCLWSFPLSLLLLMLLLHLLLKNSSEEECKSHLECFPTFICKHNIWSTQKLNLSLATTYKRVILKHFKHSIMKA